MTTEVPPPPEPSATIAVCGQPFDETLAFFTDQLGFRLDQISPADDPSMAIVSGGGVRLRLDPEITTSTTTLHIETGAAPTVTAPNGIEVRFVDPAVETVVVPDLEPDLVFSLAGDASNWVIGRAGMRYRDLIPSRLGGRYIASHIEVCDGGPVPDLVHHHAIRFQMIFCHRGWVDVVYQDQGAPFRMNAGDCVLQPPHIRHRVLESSAGAQVVEIGCPAEHDTFFDYGLELPTTTIDPDRDFGGQRFVRHQSNVADWVPSEHAGFQVQHTAIEHATNGLARVRVLRNNDATSTSPTAHDGEFWFLFVLDGSADLIVDESSTTTMASGDSVAVPAGTTWHIEHASADLTVLEVVVA